VHMDEFARFLKRLYPKVLRKQVRWDPNAL
jgi:hypothetical protein